MSRNVMGSPVGDLCVGRYARLKDSFEGVTTRDLGHLLTVEDVVSSAPPNLKMLARCFVRDKLEGFFCIDRQYLFEEDESKKQSIANGSVIDYQGQLVSSKFASLPSQDDRGVVGQVEFTTITVSAKKIDFSWNDLFDEDLPHIVDYITRGTAQAGIGALSLIVDLSGNRLTKAGFPDILELLALAVVKNVCISDNPVATVDARDELLGLSKEQLMKLVWVPELWLSTDAWTKLIQPCFRGLARQSQQNYYKQSD